MINDKEKLKKSLKIAIPIISSVAGGLVSTGISPYAAIIGIIAGKITELSIDQILTYLTEVKSEFVSSFSTPFEKGLGQAVKETEEECKSEIQKLSKNDKKWLNKKLKEICKFDTWNELNKYIPEDFDTFEDLYLGPIKDFLNEDKPKTIPDELIDCISQSLAHKVLARINDVLKEDSEEAYAVFRTLFAVFSRILPPEYGTKLEGYENWLSKIKVWVTDQIEIISKDLTVRIENLEIRMDELEKIVKTLTKRVGILEVKVAKLEEGRCFIEESKLGKWYGLPSINFQTAVERREIFKRLESIFNGEKQIAVVGLHGMAGVGKSYIVRLFIERERKRIDETFKHGILWVDVPEHATADMVATTALGYLYNSLECFEDRLTKFKSLLTGHNFLVVIDNAENLGDSEIEKFRFDSQDSRIIFTSKRSIYGIHTIEVNVMNEDEALELFRKNLGENKIKTQLNDFKKLAEALGYLPLAIDILSKRMRKHGWSAREALNRFERKKTELIRIGRGETKETNLEASFELSFRELEEFEKEFLYALSVFSQKGARIPLLADMLKKKEYELEESIEILYDLAFVRRSGGEDDEVFWSMHPLLREFAKKKAGKKNLEDFSRQFVKLMLKRAISWHRETAKTKEEGYSVEKYHRAINFVLMERENLLEAFNIAHSLNMPESIDLATYSGKLFELAGLFNDEISVLSKAESIAKELGKDEDLATIYNNLGSAYYSKGEYDKAIKYYRKALEIRLKKLGENDPDIATIYNNLGSAYYSKGEYDKAIKYYRKALEIRLKKLGENHSETASSYNNLGRAYHSKGEYDKAIEYHKKALDIDFKIFGEGHVNVARDYNNIGLVYYSKGEYNKAIEYYKKALDIVKKIYGENYPYIPVLYNNIGLVYYSKGEYNKAIEYYKKALDIVKKIYGENHPYTAISYAALGLAYNSKKEYDKAIEYHKKALDIDLKILGESHANVARDCDNIGLAYYSKGEYGKAIKYFKKALDIELKIFGENHPDTAMSYNNLGKAYNSKGEYDKAFEYLKKALKIRLKKLGEDHPDTASSYYGLGLAYNSKGEYDKAFEYLKKALKIVERKLGECHPWTQKTIENLAYTYKDKGEIEKYESLMNRLKEIKKKCKSQ